MGYWSPAFFCLFAYNRTKLELKSEQLTDFEIEPGLQSHQAGIEIT